MQGALNLFWLYYPLALAFVVWWLLVARGRSDSGQGAAA
jgi:hypothetical protein